MGDSGVRLADVLLSVSLLTDLGFNQPAGHIARSARIAMRIGERLGLQADDMGVLYDVSLLTYVGCSTYGNDSVALFGDDIEFRSAFTEIDRAGLEARTMMLRWAGAGSSPLRRAGQVARLMVTNGRGVIEQMASHCAAAGEFAGGLGLGADVRAGVEQAYVRWDGKGVPGDVYGERISLAARIAHVAEACEVVERHADMDAAIEVVQRRSGGQFDPSVASAVSVDPAALFDGLSQADVEEILDIEPAGRPFLGDDELDDTLAAVGDFYDMRSPCFAGHSRSTAALAVDAAVRVGLGEADTRTLRRAASIHDVGRAGVPSNVWDKPGPLSTSEVERMRMHVYFVERVFSRPEPLRRIGLLAATHHERADASGYHRGAGAAMLSVPARLLAAADVYVALTQPRPHRPALEPDDAAAVLRGEADAGCLDHTAADAVLEAAGHRSRRKRAPGPAGLTSRELDVVRLLVQGEPNKVIARQLGISAKTVGNHVERIYAKLGVTNRAAVAMRAMKLGIVEA